MTLQVGMVGSDGIVLASDTRWFVNCLTSGGAWQVSDASKIKIAPSGRLAVAYCREMWAARGMADALLAELNPDEENLESRIEAICSRVLSSRSWTEAECIVIVAGTVPRLYFFQSTRNGERWCNRQFTHIHAGDGVNPATFLTVAYYDASLPISQLSYLAAQVVVSAGKLLPQTIHGLEIVHCTTDGIVKLPESQNRVFEMRALKLWDEIGRSILNRAD